MIIEISGYPVIIDNEDFQKIINMGPWHCTKGKRGPYFAHDINRKKIYLHRFLISAPKGLEVDHINQNKLDNKKSNLRIVTRSENAMNMKTHNDSKSGRKGIYYDKKRKKWKAEISIFKHRFF
jgi:hypothetical protein